MTPTEWADALRASIAQMAGAMREIENMEKDAAWDAYFTAWMSDPSISKDSRSTAKSLLPAVISMSEDLDDAMLAELGINVASLPSTFPFAANQDVEAPDLKIVQIDMLEAPTESAHAVLAMTKPTRAVSIAIYTMDGAVVKAATAMSEVLSGTFAYKIDWSALSVQDGYYIVHVNDEYEMDAKIVEIKTPQTESHSLADKDWMLNNIQAYSGGGGTSVPVNGGSATFG